MGGGSVERSRNYSDLHGPTHVKHAVKCYRDVVLRDRSLRWDCQRRFLQGVHVRDAVEKRDERVKPSSQRPRVLTQTLDDVRALLRDDAKTLREELRRRMRGVRDTLSALSAQRRARARGDGAAHDVEWRTLRARCVRRKRTSLEDATHFGKSVTRACVMRTWARVPLLISWRRRLDSHRRQAPLTLKPRK